MTGDTKQRRRVAVENDEKILRAAIEMINEVGVDRVTTVGVATRAGLTTGAMYARYEHQDELLVDVWQRAGAAAVREIVESGVAVRRLGGEDRLARFVALVVEPSPEARAAIELLAVARRVDDLADVVPADLLEMWPADEPPHDVDSSSLARELSLVGYGLGLVLCGDVVLGGLDPAVGAGLLVSDAGEHWLDEALPMGAVTELARVPDDAVLDALVQAAQHVVARSGVQQATLTRIGRVARLTPTIVYTKFEGKDELIADVLHRVQASVVNAAWREVLYQGPATLASALRMWSSADAGPRRLFQRELLLTARHDRGIRAMVAELERTARDGSAPALAAVYGSEVAAMYLQSVGTATGHGLSLMVDLGFDVDRVDVLAAMQTLTAAARAMQP